MKKRWINKDTVFEQVDDDYYLEYDFERMVENNLHHLFFREDDSHLIVKEYKKRFHSVHKDEGVHADLIAFDSNFKAWWIIEVELIKHTFYGHVYEQMEKLIDVDYQSYIDVITNEVYEKFNKLDEDKFRNLIKKTRPQIITVVNRFDSNWSSDLKALGVDLISMQPYQSQGSKNSFFCTGRSLSIDEEKKSQIRWIKDIGAYRLSNRGSLSMETSYLDNAEMKVYYNDMYKSLILHKK